MAESGSIKPERLDAPRAIAAARETVLSEAEALNALAAALEGPLGAAFARACAIIQAASGRVIVTGMGKSAHIGRKIAATLASTGRPSYFVHPAEASHGDLGMIASGDCVLAISRNGESHELTDILHHCRRLKIPLMAMTFKPDSTLGKSADILLTLPDCAEAREDVPAPTTSTTMCLALGDALAIALLQAAGFTAAHYKEIHPGGKLGAMLKHVRDVMRTGDDLPLVDVAAPAEKVVAAMSIGKRAAGAVGIVENGKLVGIFVDGDLRRRLAAGTFAGAARDLMNANPMTIAPDASLADAVALLNQRQFNTMFVVEDGRPVGLIHIQDLLAAGAR
jgi:arabinose-5-phosphate isomerase